MILTFSVISCLFRFLELSRCRDEASLDPGINNNALETAVNLFKKSPLNEASDGARAVRFLEVRN